MGNFEKLVVLTVLFLTATIFGVSVHKGGEELSDDPTGTTATEEPVSKDLGTANRGSLPLSSSVELGTKSTAGGKKPAESGAKKETSKPKVVDSNKTEPKSTERVSILISTEGLSPALGSDEYMTYVLKQGDSRTVVANRYYGNMKYKAMLQRDNEGVPFIAGGTILLAIYDFEEQAGQRESVKPAPRHDAPKVVITKAPAKVTKYTVVEGDSLWNISLATYGKGSFWGEIFKVNRDQMSDENDIQVGMVLRLPAL
jgi:hypothetical protein